MFDLGRHHETGPVKFAAEIAVYICLRRRVSPLQETYPNRISC